MDGTSPARNFAHASGNVLGNPVAQELIPHLLPSRGQWRSGISATIVASPGTLLDNATLLASPHFMYKVLAISALDLKISSEETFVGVIKTARRPNVEIDHRFTFFSLTPIAQDNVRVEK